ncbi:uncharacterized protein LOC126668171 [Mercurialis annua]|uniref:uncharacterized protein LOC126668171 n=2 Tax=Mercurialis annua TaxID=3986 RepID=UPI00215EBE27|nr:uncharacterized protein LOC126668171 [Mercurialis annua]
MQYIMEGIMEENNLAEVLDAEVVYEEEEVTEDHEIGLEELEQAPPWIDDEAIHVREELEEVNLGTSEEPQEYKDCFAWQYSDMPGLSRTLVEHRLPIKPEFQPYRQPPRRVSKEVELKVKEEIEKLCKAGFIRPAKYSNWLANVVPVVKKNGKLRICIDFRDLNEATPKDIYAMPIADTLIDATANHSLLSFMDCFAGYNQIMVAKEDISKTAFRCLGSIGTFEWVVMPFGLRNAGATYQRAMNAIFHDLLGKTMEVYIDDVVVKSKLMKDHLKNLEEAFRRMRVHCLKLNPLKCAFGVKAGNFLGFLVHERGIEVDQNKTKAIREAKPPRNKTELQRFLGQVNYLRRFISNLAGKTKVFSELLKLKKEDVFRWETIHQEAFDEIKDYLMKPPVLMPPKKGIPLRLYISAAEGSIGCLLAQSNQDGHEQAIYYLSRSMTSTELIESFEEVELVHVPREENWEADELSQLASGLRLSEELTHRLVMVQRKTHPSIFKRGVQLDIFNIDDNLVQDWRRDIKKYLENPSKKMMYKVRVRAVNYVLIEDVLYRRGFDNLLLRCLGTTEALEVMKQTHEGVCGAHQSGVKMRWLIRRHGYFWPSILKDCMTFAKGCQSCQRYGNIQRLPAAELKSVIKPWPFRGWAIDLIGKIYPPSSKNHSFIIVATDYFTKWVVAKPLVKTEQKDVIKFIKEEIIHQFGIPQSVTTDQGTMFTGKEMQEFATDYGIKLLTSTPYYAQANGQAESSNKIIINIVQKMLEENPKDWHRILSEALWAYRTSRRNATGVSPFMLTYGHDAVLPMEVVVRSLRVAKQNHLTPEDYNETMMMELENLEEGRLQALNNMIIQKKKVSRSYNKKVRPKTFQEDELVWKLILPPGTKDREYGKWSTNWEGPFLVHKVMKGNAYWLSSLEGEPHRKFINGKYLKKYTPTIWEKYNLEMT